jgi:hypothetical protein
MDLGNFVDEARERQLVFDQIGALCLFGHIFENGSCARLIRSPLSFLTRHIEPLLQLTQPLVLLRCDSAYSET